MQRGVSLVLLFLLCLTQGACRRSSTTGESHPKPDSQDEATAGTPETADLGDFLIAAPVRYQNLAIFPVLSKVPKEEDRYITLEEGLKAGTIEIFEVGADGARINQADDELPPQSEESPAEQINPEPSMEPESDISPAEDPLPDEEPPVQPGLQQTVTPEGLEELIQQVDVPQVDVAQIDVAGDVNRLMVLNTSGKPLYLMPGEVIYGGKQDRTIGEETIILASNEPQPVEVYCVEQGRWSGREEADSVDALMSISDGQIDEETARKLAAEANSGKFVASAGNLSKKSRLAVQAGKGEQAQGEVWNAVGDANAAANIEVQSGAFTANYANQEVVDQLKPYMEKLQAPVAEQKQVVGAIVAVNGKVESVDVFGSTPLFRKLWPKLLKSHALDAANAADAAEATKVCTLEDAQKFLNGAMQADVEDSQTEGGLVVTKRDSQGVVSFSAATEDAAAAPGTGMGMGGFGGGVHSSAFAK